MHKVDTNKMYASKHHRSSIRVDIVSLKGKGLIKVNEYWGTRGTKPQEKNQS